MPAQRNAVVVASDNNFLVPALWLWRRLQRLNPRPDTDIILITEEKCPSIPAALSLCAADLPLPDLEFPVNSHISKASYWRIAAPQLLAKNYGRLLYLDVDILPVDATLFECFDYDLGQSPFAACQCASNFTPKRQTEDGKVYDGGFTFARYFNSGVMLIDVRSYLEAGISERTYDVILKHGAELTYNDQTALNIAANDLWADLPLSYNFWAAALRTFLAERMKPKIIHYHGIFKPWHLMTPYPENSLRLRMLANMLLRGQLRLTTTFAACRVRRRLRRGSGVERAINPQNAKLMSYLERTAFLGL